LDTSTSDVPGEKIKEKDDTDLLEMIIFTLSPVMGGRDQVLATPFIETLKYLDLELKRRKADRWNRYMDALYAHPMGVDNDKRKKYMELIQPQPERKEMKLETNVDQLREIKRQQEERAKLAKAQAMAKKQP